jgi:PAS domain-containing protein
MVKPKKPTYEELEQMVEKLEEEVQEHLRLKEQMFCMAQEWKQTFEAANSAIWILDQEQRVVRSNKGADKFFKRETDELSASGAGRSSMAQPIRSLNVRLCVQKRACAVSLWNSKSADCGLK